MKSRLEVRKPKLAPLEFNWAGILAAPTVEANFDAQGSLRTGLPSGIFSLKTKVKLGGSPGTTARHVGVETKECAFDTQRTEARVLAAFSCPFTFGGRFMTSAATDEVLRALNRGRRFAVNIDFGLSTPDPLSFDEPSQLRLRVEPVQNRTGLRARGFIDTEVTFAPVKFPKAESVSSRLDLFLGIDEFQDLVRELGGGPIAVPAPFRTLRGPLRAEFKGSLFDADRPVQARFVSKLSSRHQKLELESDTRIHVELRDEAKPRVHASGDVLLKRVHLVAPPIDGLPPGQLRPDPRIVLAPDPQPRAQPPRRNDAGFELNYDFRVRTPKDSPMKIAISAAEEPLPVGLEMRFSDSRPLNGTATLGGLNAGVYGIRAELESGRFQFRFSPRSSLIAGGIRAGGENVPFALPQSQTDELIQPDPSFPAPFGEMVSALMAGFPLQVTVREPEFLSPPQNSSLEQGFLLEFRRRY